MPEDRPSAVVVRAVAAEETRRLRLDVLRPGQPPESAVYPGDDDPGTVHLAAVVQGDVAGIASLYREGREGRPGWRLRGMATSPGQRRRGVGRALLDACVARVAATGTGEGEGGGGGGGGDELWCNARLVAVPFYLANGFEVVSDEFEVAGLGPHVVMRRIVTGPTVTGRTAR